MRPVTRRSAQLQDDVTFTLGAAVAKAVFLGATPLQLGLQHWYSSPNPRRSGHDTRRVCS